MTLTFQLGSLRDALAKAKREFNALEAAVAAEELVRIGDCLYNFSVSVYHVKDWLAQESSARCSERALDAFVRATPSLSVCRDL